MLKNPLRFFVFLMALSLAYPSFAGQGQAKLSLPKEDKEPRTALVLMKKELPQFASYEKEDSQPTSRTGAFISSLRKLIFMKLDHSSTLEAMLACKLWRREIIEAMTEARNAWNNGKSPGNLRNQFFHPLLLSLLHNDIATLTPVYRVPYRKEETEEASETSEILTLPELVSEYIETVKRSSAATKFFSQLSLGLDPAADVRKVCLGARLVEKSPEMKRLVKEGCNTSIFEYEKFKELAGETPNHGKLKRHLMGLKLLALTGDKEAIKSLTNFADKLSGIYMNYFELLEKAVKQPLWVCYTDRLDLVNSHCSFLQDAQECLWNEAGYFADYCLALFDFERETMLFLNGVKSRDASYKGDCQKARELGRSLLQQVDSDNVHEVLGFADSAFLNSMEPLSEENYTKLQSMLNANLAKARDNSPEYFFLKYIIAKGILNQVDLDKFQDASDYLNELLNSFGDQKDISLVFQIKELNTVVEVILKEDILGALATLALYQHQFDKALECLKETKNYVDFPILWALKDQLSHPDLPKKIVSLISPRARNVFKKVRKDYDLGVLETLRKLLDIGFFEQIFAGHPIEAKKFKNFLSDLEALKKEI